MLIFTPAGCEVGGLINEDLPLLQEKMLDTTKLLTLGFAFAVGYVFYKDRKGDPREPPLVTSAIPLVGHLLGLIFSGFGYFTMLA